MNNITSELAAIAQNPLQRARRWKEANKGVIGCFPMHVPEEIIHASGVLPITLLGSNETVTASDKYLQPFLCHVARSTLDMALTGKLDFLDGIVFPDVCDIVQLLPDIWNIHYPMPFQHTVVVAGKFNSASSQQYLVSEYNALRKSLENFTGKQITEDDLRQSISIYNYNRDLLHKLYRIRMDNPGILSAREIATLVMTSMLMPKEEHSELLLEVLDKAGDKKKSMHGSTRLIISGSPCVQPEWEVLDLIEKLGAVVVNDDLYAGRRYFNTKVSDSLPPIEALVAHYSTDVPCPTKHNQDKEYAENIVNLAKEAKAHGVIMLMVKYCEPYSFAYPETREELARQGIPHLMIEIEPPTSIELIQTQIQTFIETLEG